MVSSRSPSAWLVALALAPACYTGMPALDDGGDDDAAGDVTGVLDTDGAHGESPADDDDDGGVDDGLDVDDGDPDDGASDLDDDGSDAGDTGDTGDPPGVCGDGIVQDDEACDHGDANGPGDGCKADCTANVCGDGEVGPGEGCDDGNTDDTDGCTNACALASCGDGNVDAGEACDDGNDDDTDACSNTCTSPECGDGIVQAGEACDEGGSNSDTGACTTSCDTATCGDGHVWAGMEECDLGGGNGANAACTPECTDATCGDGYVGPGEDCDDGNAVDGDACSNACEVSSGNELPDNAYCNQVDDWSAEWVDFELEVIDLVNEARSQVIDCGSGDVLGPVAPIAYEAALTCAARNHSKDMGENDFFSHTNLAGDGPSERLADAGYDWSTWGENIAAGYATPQQVVDGWIASHGHCTNLMNGAFTQLGVGYYYAPGSDYGHYWTQDFGTPG